MYEFDIESSETNKNEGETDTISLKKNLNFHRKKESLF